MELSGEPPLATGQSFIVQEIAIELLEKISSISVAENIYITPPYVIASYPRERGNPLYNLGQMQW